MPPKAIILRTAGTNCDAEMVRGFQLAGAHTDLIHLDRVIANPRTLDQYDLIGFPGGFSYGDDVAAGRVFAVRARERLWPALREAAARGTPMLGVCNGFQVMTQLGLLPGFAPGAWPEHAPEPTAALAENAGGRFIDDWAGIEVDPASPCIWTRDLPNDPEVMLLPLASGEGRFIAAADSVMRELNANRQIPLRYTEQGNLNGSTDRIAGICDPSGRIFALMPHPDRYLDWLNHPFATRLAPDKKRGRTPGALIFASAVESIRAAGAFA